MNCKDLLLFESIIYKDLIKELLSVFQSKAPPSVFLGALFINYSSLIPKNPQFTVSLQAQVQVFFQAIEPKVCSKPLCSNSHSNDNLAYAVPLQSPEVLARINF